MRLARQNQGRSTGFSLIELMIAIVIFAFLVLLAGPMYTTYMGNAQIRNAGEAMLNGVRLAQADAIKYNVPAVFILDAANGWAVHEQNTVVDGADKVIDSYALTGGAARTTITPSSGAVTFDGLGRVMPNADASASLTAIDITNTNVASADRRPLRVVISAIGGTSGGTKLCDPGLPSTDPAGCP